MASISIIIPFQKGLHYLRDCLESIEAQLLTDYEVLLIGDGITEDLTEILKEFQSKLNIRFLNLEEGTGVAAARNLGLRLASCDYVYFLDSDDYLVDHVLQGMLKVASESKACMVYGPIVKTWFKRKSFLQEYEGTIGEQATGERNAQEHLLENRFANDASVLNLLLDRVWLMQLGITFDETLQFYSDLPFVTVLLWYAFKNTRSSDSVQEQAACVMDHTKERNDNQNVEYDLKAVYAKRIHNDSIQYPSLSQIASKDRPEEFVRAYQSAKRIISHTDRSKSDTAFEATYKDRIIEALDQYLYRYLVALYTGKYHSRKEAVLSKIQVSLCRQALLECTSTYVARESKNEQRILDSIRKGNNKAAIKYANRILLKRKKKGLFGNQIQRARAIDKILFGRLSKKENWIVFESFLGASYSDSSKYIYEYLLKHHQGKFRCIWAINDRNVEIPGNPRKVKPGTLSYVYYMSRAKYWVNNMRQPIWLNKRPGTVFLETWHGTPLKKLVFDMEDIHSASPNYKSDFYMQSRKWDYLISDNAFSTEVFQSAFLFDKEKILEYGYPRNDILHATNREAIAGEIKRRLDLPHGKKVILYAPTWRDDEFYEPGKYKFNLALDLERIKAELGEEYVILLRTHYFIADQLDLTGLEGFAYNVSQYEDVSELYLISDICITDYSSVFFDYANLRRPILFFTYDLDKYKDVLRGFYIDMETEVPGPLLQTNDELIHAIRNIEEINESYAKRYEEFYRRFCSLDDGNAAKRVVEKVFL